MPVTAKSLATGMVAVAVIGPSAESVTSIAIAYRP